MNDRGPRRALVLFLVGTMMLGATVRSVRAQPTPITVPNAGFEDRASFDPFPNGTDKYNQWAMEAWRHFESDNNGGPLRIWNPGDADDPDLTAQGIADIGFGGEAPEGDYVVVVRSRYNDDEFHEPPRVRDFEAAVQLLPEVFDPTRTYTLTVEVGRLPGSDYYTPLWFGYAVQLAVGGTNVDGARFAGRVDGGTVIAEDYNSVEVEEDEFVVATVTYTPDPADADLAGLPLQIRLAALEDEDDHALTGWVAFDDVELTVDDAEETGEAFRRGDANGDGNADLSDAVFVLNYLFTGGPAPTCLKTADVNDSGGRAPDLTDPVYLLNFLFLGGPPPAAPFGECGIDTTDDELGCDGFPSCP